MVFMQLLSFALFRYIKIVGTHNTVNRMFHVVAVQAFYTKKEFSIDSKWNLVGKLISSGFQSGDSDQKL